MGGGGKGEEVCRDEPGACGLTRVKPFFVNVVRTSICAIN